MQVGYINAWLASPSVSLTLSTKHVIHVIIYAVECFSEKKRMPQLSLALFICTDPVTEEEKLNRVVVGTPESPEKKKQPLKVTEKLIRFVNSNLHLKSTAHINVSSRLLRACTTRTQWALKEREQ